MFWMPPATWAAVSNWPGNFSVMFFCALPSSSPVTGLEPMMPLISAAISRIAAAVLSRWTGA